MTLFERQPTKQPMTTTKHHQLSAIYRGLNVEGIPSKSGIASNHCTFSPEKWAL